MTINDTARDVVTSLPRRQDETPAVWERAVGLSLRLAVGLCLLPIVVFVAVLTLGFELIGRCWRLSGRILEAAATPPPILERRPTAAPSSPVPTAAHPGRVDSRTGAYWLN